MPRKRPYSGLKKLTDRQKESLMRAYNDWSIPIQELVDRFQVTRENVHQFALQNKLTIRPSRGANRVKA